MSREDTAPIVDPSTRICLQHGRTCCGHHHGCLPAFAAVDDGGGTSLWLLCPGDDAPLAGSLPDHEHLGQLPPTVRARLRRGATCSRPTHAGRPCTRPVTALGQPCHQHTTRRTSA